ncbi:unnamed protein product [Heterobilharzia americana]|nr:unnamed protein product [Heterobilharzia americana]
MYYMCKMSSYLPPIPFTQTTYQRSVCRSSVVNTDFNKTVEQKADIHWLPCQEDSKHASLQKAMHRSSSVPVHCCTTASNLVITPYTP